MLIEQREIAWSMTRRRTLFKQNLNYFTLSKMKILFAKSSRRYAKSNTFSFTFDFFFKLRYNRIIVFVDAIHKIVEHVFLNDLSKFVSNDAFVIIKTINVSKCNEKDHTITILKQSFNKVDISFEKIAKSLDLFNSKISQFKTEIRRFSYDFTLQTSLQEIFATYMNALLRIMKYIKLSTRCEFECVFSQSTNFFMLTTTL